MSPRVRARCFLFYCLIHFSHVSLACILLLNGWTPLSVYERSALSDIVASGEVLRTFKQDRTERGTYTAEVRIFTVHKGAELVRKVQASSGRLGNSVFNVTNFGDTASCYADVIDEELYVFFLTVFQNRLSAKYDDIFGAVASYTQENEQEVLDYLDQSKQAEKRKAPCNEPLRSDSHESEQVGGKMHKEHCYPAPEPVMAETEPDSVSQQSLEKSGDTTACDNNSSASQSASSCSSDQDVCWHPWSTWSACSETCGNGQQSRRRTCSRENVSQCEGSEMDTRHCNTFSCTDVFDLLSLFGIPKLPFGVTHSQDRNDAYVITPTAKLFLPVSSLYDVTFPHDFSIIMTSRRKAEQEGYVLVVSDISGRQRIAVYIGKQLRLEYMDDPSRSVVSLEFGVTLDTDTWHNIAIRVKGRQITLFFDCDTVQEKKLKRGNNFLGTNLMLSVGPYFANYGPAFEGELEQLLLSDDPGLAERQCHFQTGDHIGPIKDDNSNIGPDVEPQTTPNPPKDTHKITRPTLVYADWSPWSSCSDTCGQGRQSRTLSCTETELYGTDAGGSDVVGDANCVPNDTPRVQVRTCWVQACAVGCREPCQNGGTCVDSGVCRCLPGYYGNFCQSAVCSPGCENGGVCISPGKCQCPKNFTGNRCETPVCDPPCLNGGQCTAPNQCACPSGYTGANCQPFCLKECHNGGVCVRHDQCRCTKGYRGRFCKQPVCRRGCANGGKCVSPNRCSCPSGFRGRRCHKPRCRPSCKNGGKCIAPDVCMCPPGFLGARCQKYKCERKCRNGGKCVGPGRCECKAGFYGKFCQREKCNLTCLNGGRCRRHKNRCRCPKGFRGRRCEKRSCVYQQYTVPYTKTYKRTVREEVMTRCGPWSWKSCVRTIIRYVTVTKDAVRAAYRCV